MSKHKRMTVADLKKAIEPFPDGHVVSFHGLGIHQIYEDCERGLWCELDSEDYGPFLEEIVQRRMAGDRSAINTLANRIRDVPGVVRVETHTDQSLRIFLSELAQETEHLIYALEAEFYQANPEGRIHVYLEVEEDPCPDSP